MTKAKLHMTKAFPCNFAFYFSVKISYETKGTWYSETIYIPPMIKARTAIKRNILHTWVDYDA